MLRRRPAAGGQGKHSSQRPRMPSISQTLHVTAAIRAGKTVFEQYLTFRNRKRAIGRRTAVKSAASACEHIQRSSWRGASLPRRQPGTASPQWRSASGGAGACLPTLQVRLFCTVDLRNVPEDL